MTSIFHKFRTQNRSGNILIGMFLLMGVLVIAGSISRITIFRGSVSQKKNQQTRHNILVAGGIETFLFAYRMAESAYIENISTACGTANTFIRALKEGINCSSPIDSISVFTQEDTSLNNGVFSYAEGLKLRQSDSCKSENQAKTCGDEIIQLMSISGTESFDGVEFKIFFVSVNPEKQIVEFFVESSYLDPASGKQLVSKNAFALRSSLENAAHFRYDGKVVQESPDPLSPCSGEIWAPYNVYNSSTKDCEHFSQLAGGTGLAFYKSRYYGLNSFSGTILDLMALSNSNTFIISESGDLGSEGGRFPAHDRTSLINVDDITTISDDIYFVAGQGTSAHIGALVPGGRIKICELGMKGWAQAYSGIGALGWSDPIMQADSYSPKPYATFFLKTDTGDLLQTVVQRKAGSGVATGPDDFECFTFKDMSQQDINYKITMGFERAQTSKPYYVY